MSLLVFISSTISCTTSDEHQTMEQRKIEYAKKLSVDDLKNMHQDIKKQVSKSFEIVKNNEYSKDKSTFELETNFEANFENDLQYNQVYGHAALFKKYNLNIDILNAFNWLQLNKSVNLDIQYTHILNTFNLNENEINYLFIYHEVTEYLNSNLVDNLNRKHLSNACRDAVLNTVMVTVIFTGVVIFSGGVGLPAAVGFFASKAWSMRGLYKNC